MEEAEGLQPLIPLALQKRVFINGELQEAAWKMIEGHTFQSTRFDNISGKIVKC